MHFHMGHMASLIRGRENARELDRRDMSSYRGRDILGHADVADVVILVANTNNTPFLLFVCFA